MGEKKAPEGIRVNVPEEQGSAYEGEWVERKQRMGQSFLKEFEGLGDFLTEEKAFKNACKLFARTFTDWTLSGDDGPLPKPWANPAAFKALIDSDLDLLLWVIGLVYRPISELLALSLPKN